MWIGILSDLSGTDTGGSARLLLFLGASDLVEQFIGLGWLELDGVEVSARPEFQLRHVFEPLHQALRSPLSKGEELVGVGDLLRHPIHLSASSQLNGWPHNRFFGSGFLHNHDAYWTGGNQVCKPGLP